ncbi:MAG: hypothetical protein AB7V16_01765 [Vulcanibacillus sp.]
MKKLLIFGTIIILLVTFLVFLFFYSVWSKEQAIEKQMVSEAYEKVPALYKVEDIDYFSGDKHYYFIRGKSIAGNDLLVWINKEEVHFTYLFDWVTKDEIINKVLEYDQKLIVKRITMGLNFEGIPIYEVLFTDDEGRLGYQYYKIETGELIKTYKLGKLR